MHPDDSIGKYCAFSNYDTYLDAAALYCYQFRSPFHVPKGDSQSNIYQMKIGHVPDGYGGEQIFWGMLTVLANLCGPMLTRGREGNYKIDKGDEYHLVNYDECMNSMKEIGSRCQKDG